MPQFMLTSPDGRQLTIAGVIQGLGAAFSLARLIARFLFGVKSWDPLYL